MTGQKKRIHTTAGLANKMVQRLSSAGIVEAQLIEGFKGNDKEIRQWFRERVELLESFTEIGLGAYAAPLWSKLKSMMVNMELIEDDGKCKDILKK